MSEKVTFTEEIDDEDYVEGADETNPMLKTLSVIGDKWNILISSHLLNEGDQTIEEIMKGFPDLNINVLQNKLEKLQECGIIEKDEDQGSDKKYRLTESGNNLQPLLSEMKDWGKKSNVKAGKGKSVRMAKGKTIKANQGKIKIR